ncbi:uncharacterized protein L3040_008872 [Drepanopeziza brunnea f. sp. 'multigermtubi']|uniref:uncharacterized protein n=1 Tax=Drepanopeziza brunnea f. sp. 'multigermtubi' TaxID=698441 RepID=UPI00239D38FA|nr:hypothetical protein L3040_008872 [Drepanopeziza brunnea f. sp. 'multigermtubi']
MNIKEHSQEEEIDNGNPLSATPTDPKTSTPSPATPDSPLTYEAFRQLRASGHSPHALIASILIIQHVPRASIPFLVLGASIPFSESSDVEALQGQLGYRAYHLRSAALRDERQPGLLERGAEGGLGAVKTWVPQRRGR